jgi:hypothetical protein
LTGIINDYTLIKDLTIQFSAQWFIMTEKSTQAKWIVKAIIKDLINYSYKVGKLEKIKAV